MLIKHKRLLNKINLKTYCTKAKLYDTIATVQNSLGLRESRYPISAKIIAESFISCGLLEIIEEAFIKLSGMLIKNNFPKKSYIIINSELNDCERNFALAHELIHFLCHSVDNGLMCTPYSSKTNDWHEWRANEGAAELLLPYRKFITDFSILEQFITCFDIEKLMAKKFQVSDKVIAYRIIHLRYEID